ncbi:MAG TPA: CpsB/CapC family capsule biosynthesis tyrosine phosphatase [Thermoanaerobaculia bacterium]
MIDIHHHCLPGVDDGPRDLAEAVELCRAAAEEGIETIVCTPHVLRGRWQNTSRQELERRMTELQATLGDTPRLLLGSEYFFAHDINEVLESGSGIIPLAGSRYVLIELDANAVPPLIEQPLYRMQLAGWTPILAHPERNKVLQVKPELLASLVAAGVRTQVTAESFTGRFGTTAEKSARQMLAAGLVHFLASDAHNLKRRPPNVREALAIVAELAGADVADALARRNPRCVIEHRALDYEPEPAPPSRPGGFLRRLRQFWGAS